MSGPQQPPTDHDELAETLHRTELHLERLAAEAEKARQLLKLALTLHGERQQREVGYGC